MSESVVVVIPIDDNGINRQSSCWSMRADVQGGGQKRRRIPIDNNSDAHLSDEYPILLMFPMDDNNNQK